MHYSPVMKYVARSPANLRGSDQTKLRAGEGRNEVGKWGAREDGRCYLQPRRPEISARRRVRYHYVRLRRQYIKRSYQEAANKMSAVKFYTPVKGNLIKAAQSLLY